MAVVANQRSPPPQLASDYGELERPVFPWPGVLHICSLLRDVFPLFLLSAG